MSRRQGREGGLGLLFHGFQLRVGARGSVWWKSANCLVPAIFASSMPCSHVEWPKALGNCISSSLWVNRRRRDRRPASFPARPDHGDGRMLYVVDQRDGAALILDSM